MRQKKLKNVDTSHPEAVSTGALSVPPSSPPEVSGLPTLVAHRNELFTSGNDISPEILAKVTAATSLISAGFN